MATPKVVLVTGGARRLGAATLRELHGRGWQVLIHCHHSRAEADALAAELNQLRGGSARVLVANLHDHEALLALGSNAVSAWGRLDALINNASGFYPTPIGEATPAQWQDLMGSNAQAPFFLSQALAPALRRTQGCIINMVDVHASKPLARHTLYAMAKAALLMMTKSLAQELAPDIRVNGIAPGAILWPEDTNEEAQQRILQGIPMQRTGTPADIARTIAFLVEDAPYITGQILAVDGGRSL